METLPEIVETECFLYNQKMEEDIGVRMPEVPAKIMFHISDVSFVRECSDEGEIYENRCLVVFKCGESLIINKPYQLIADTKKQFQSK